MATRGQALHGAAGKAVNFGIIVAFAMFAAFPFAWMLITMFKQTRDLLDPGHMPFIYNLPPTLDNLRVVKTAYERKVLVKSLEISSDAQMAGMLAAHPGAYEYEVKAAYVYNFARFIEWPKADPPTQFTICMYGRDAYGGFLDDATRIGGY